MTHAICMICGAPKPGAFINCRECRFTPETGFELAYSMLLSDHNQSLERLSELNVQISRIYLEKRAFEISVELASAIEAQLLKPDWRDVMTLKRSARDGLFEKQVNGHFTTPDGYEHRVIGIRKGSALDAIRKDGKNDIFFVTFFENGARIDNQVSKPAWYACVDIATLASRHDKNPMIAKSSELSESLANAVLEKERGRGHT